MRLTRCIAYAGVSITSLMAAPAFGQGAQGGADSSLGAVDGEIVVHARRRDELAQDVPLVVNAVTSESLAKLNIRDFRDVETVVPGLQLTPAPNGTQSNASLRGIFNDITAAGFNPSVQFYLNEGPIALSSLLTSMFDVGQIEVLRGPVGTLRGRAAPSGSITITTRAPDLQEVGGYINMTGQTHGAINLNGAVGLPIIKDVLAVRVAGLVDQSNSTRINSLTDRTSPYSRTHGERVSVRFDPIDTLTINASFTNVERDVRDFPQLESGNIVDPTVPASPLTITSKERLSLAAEAVPLRTNFKFWNWQADWRVGGQRVVYVGTYSKSRYVNDTLADQANVFAGLPSAARLAGQPTDSRTVEQSHELRLQSDERAFGLIDYVIGGLYYKTKPETTLSIETPVFLGLFQNPATFRPAATNFASLSSTMVERNSKAIEKSVFANLTFHLGENTELSAGGRYISYKSDNFTVIAAAGLNRNDPSDDDQWIYSGSLKHRFNPNVMVYASIGSSWRPGSTSNGIIDTNIAPSPIEAALQTQQTPETSTSYEIGFKSDFMDNRVRFNLSAFHQDFRNFIYFAPNIYVAYTDPSTRAQSARMLSGLATGVPAKVDGVEAELSFKATPHWNLAANATYARSRIKDGVVPCNNFTGTPTYAGIRNANGGVGGVGGETVGTCNVSFSASRSAPFSATVQSEYMAPLSSDVDAFVRGLFTFNGRSKGDPTNLFDDVKSYGLTNLFTGIRSPEGTWEVSLFARNLFDVERVLTRNANLSGAAYQQLTCVAALGPLCGGRNQTAGGTVFSTYRGITTTAPREFGLNVRYAFGSR